MQQIVVGMADFRMAILPDQVLATFALGSCIGLAVHDARACVGGLLHYMLPASAADPPRARENPSMFADTGIALLIQQVCAAGAVKRNLVAYAAGGASLVDSIAGFDIGKRNYLALHRILWKEGVLLRGEAVGGSVSRTMRLEIGSGRLWLQEGAGPSELVPGVVRGAPPLARPGDRLNVQRVDTERKSQWHTGS
jgi:chemotaxis protein CheD